MSSQAMEKSDRKNWNTRYLDQLDYPTQYEFIAAIFHMGLLSDWSHSHLQSLNHDPLDLEQSSIRLCHGTKTSCLGVPTRLPITKSLLSFSTSIRREHYTIVCFKRGLLSKQCQRVPALPLLPLNFQHSELKKEDDLWADPSILSMSFFGDGGVRFEPARYFYLNMGVKLVMVKDQSLVRCSVLLEYDCGANALG